MAIARAGITLPEGARIDVEVPREPEHGDWATPIALSLAKTARKPPRQVAEALREALELTPDVVSAVEIAGPGFLNFRLAPAWLAGNLSRILGDPEHYGASAAGRGDKILVDYVSANPTVPLNVVSEGAASRARADRDEGRRPLVQVHRVRRPGGPGHRAEQRRAHLLPRGCGLPSRQVHAGLRSCDRSPGAGSPRPRPAHAGRGRGAGMAEGTFRGDPDPVGAPSPRRRAREDVEARG